MKKLLIAAFAASSMCVFAEATAISSIDFESEAIAVDTAAVDITEGDAGKKYFKADGADVSAVKAYDQEKPAPAKETEFFATAGNNYLNLETEGGTLWRTINPLQQVADSTEYTTPVKEVGSQIYLDTLVQFTATEDDVTSLDGDAKFALWLYKGETDETAQLKVMAGNITDISSDDGTPTITPTTYTLSGVTVEPGAWYQLTIKAVPMVNASKFGRAILGFAVYLDGTKLTIDGTDAFISENALETLKGFNAEDFICISDEQVAAFEQRKYLPSLKATVEVKSNEDTTIISTISEVGFKGTGAIDNIAWTDDEIMEAIPEPSTDVKIEVEGVEIASVSVETIMNAGFGGEHATAAEATAAFTAEMTTKGGNPIAAWQAYYLGLYDPKSQDKTVEDVEIDSISFDANGNVVVTMKGTPVANAPVTITYTLKKCADIAAPKWDDVVSTTDPNAIQAVKGDDDQSFYKVEVSFGAKQQAAE